MIFIILRISVRSSTTRIFFVMSRKPGVVSSIRHRNLVRQILSNALVTAGIKTFPRFGFRRILRSSMKRFVAIAVFLLVSVAGVSPQSGRVTGYSESGPARVTSNAAPSTELSKNKPPANDADVVRVPTDLVTIPVRITAPDGKPISNVARNEFKIFENGVEQEIAYFSNDEQPFTVALILDMSYSSVFKLEDIQLAARIFVSMKTRTCVASRQMTDASCVLRSKVQRSHPARHCTTPSI